MSSVYQHGYVLYGHSDSSQIGKLKITSMAISGTDLLEVPAIYKAYLLGLYFKGHTLQFLWPNIWYERTF